MFAGTLDACREPQNLALLKSLRSNDGDDLWLAFRQRPGLVDYEGVDFFHALQRFGVFDQDASLSAAPDANHDRHRRGKTESTGTGNDEHTDRGEQAKRHAGFRPKVSPGAKSDHRDHDHRGHEPAGDLIGQPLDRRARALRLRDHFNDLGKQRVAPDFFGAHHESAGLIESAGDHLRASLFADRHGFACHQRFVEGRATLEDDPIHRHLFSGAYPQSVACNQTIDLNLVVGAIISDPASGFGRQFQKGLDRAGRCLACAELKDLAEKNQDGDNRGSFEVNRDGSAVPTEACREAFRGEGSDYAVEVGNARAHRDQRKHVEIAREQRLPRPHEERPTRPDHDRRGKHQLDPVRQGLIDPTMTTDEVTAHFQNDHRQREHEANPEAPRHVGKLGIGRRIQAGNFGL